MAIVTASRSLRGRPLHFLFFSFLFFPLSFPGSILAIVPDLSRPQAHVSNLAQPPTSNSLTRSDAETTGEESVKRNAIARCNFRNKSQNYQKTFPVSHITYNIHKRKKEKKNPLQFYQSALAEPPLFPPNNPSIGPPFSPATPPTLKTPNPLTPEKAQMSASHNQRPDQEAHSQKPPYDRMLDNLTLHHPPEMPQRRGRSTSARGRSGSPSW
ncbi:hypothetical protein KC342_g1 [Hortaea werneckii]|nr:hypothetical protein KC342_g1 [Hortaea werneckii]